MLQVAKARPNLRARHSARPECPAGAAASGRQRHQARHRAPRAGDHHLLPGFHILEQPRQMGLGFVDIDCFHARMVGSWSDLVKDDLLSSKVGAVNALGTSN